jgi:hypothetical protein
MNRKVRRPKTRSIKDWLCDGDKDFKRVNEVQKAILEKLGRDYTKTLGQGLTAENLQAIVDIFEVAEEQGCAAGACDHARTHDH